MSAEKFRMDGEELRGVGNTMLPVYFSLMHARALVSLQLAGFLDLNGEVAEGNVPVPDFDTAMNTFTPEELVTAREFQEAELTIEPELEVDIFKLNTMTRLQEAMQKKQHLLRGSDRILGWRVAFVEGKVEMEPLEDDDPKLPVVDRIAEREKNRLPGEKGISLGNYAMLSILGQSLRMPIDQKTVSIIDGDNTLPLESPYSTTKGPHLAGYEGDSFSFGPIYSGVVDERARLRRVVGGNVLLQG